MTEPLVNINLSDGIGDLTLARPEKRNALKRSFIEQFIAGLDQLSAEPSLRLLRIRAHGSVFCAGMDLGEMQERASSEDGKAEWQRDSEVYAELLLKLFQLPVPTIAALQGPALAGGVGMVLACDLVVAATRSFLMLPEPMRGITAAMVTPFLVYRAGAGAATQLLLSGQRMSASRCHQLGIFHEVLPPVEAEDKDTTNRLIDRELETAIDSLSQSILTGSRNALAITKQHVQRCAGQQIENLLQQSILVSAQARETDDAREGLAAFLEKRDPVWT